MFPRIHLIDLTTVAPLLVPFIYLAGGGFYQIFRLVFGTLFPAYYSYKAVKTKNVKEYVKWMMYWIVFAFFTCFETLTDLFVSFWFPFYYELKILVVLWLLSPATRGSSILYRKFVHPWLARREDDIDQCIAQARHQGYSTVVQLGTKGVNYATTVLMQTAIKGGGGLMSQLRRSYSQSELVGDDSDLNRNVKALPRHDHYASDYALDHHAHPAGTSHTPPSPGVLGRPPLHTTGPLQPPAHTTGCLQLEPHSASSVQVVQQQVSTTVAQQALHLASPPPASLCLVQPHTPSPMDTSHSPLTTYTLPGSLGESPYSPIRYITIATPQAQSPTLVEPPTSPPMAEIPSDASYTPPLTRHRARQQQQQQQQQQPVGE